MIVEKEGTHFAKKDFWQKENFMEKNFGGIRRI